MKYIIQQDRDDCIGCGTCESICPDNWVMEDDGKASPIETELEELGCNHDAELNCPSHCIRIKKQK